MNSRKVSFEEYDSTYDDTIDNNHHNRAILLSHNDTLSSTRQSVIFSETLTSDSSQMDCTVDEIKSELSKKLAVPRIISDEILLEPYDTAEKQKCASRIAGCSCKKFECKATSQNERIQKEDNAFDVNDIQNSQLWPALTILEDTLSSHDDTGSNDIEYMMESLNTQFNYSPRSFTESLITICEESFAETYEKSGDALNSFMHDVLKKTGKLSENETPSDRVSSLSGLTKTVTVKSTGISTSPGLDRLLNKADDAKKLVENESPPECMISLLSESEIHSNFSHSSCTFTDESTEYLSLQRLNVVMNNAAQTPNIDDKTFIKAPTIIGNPATELAAQTLNTNDETFLRTPTIVVNPATPMNATYRKKPKTRRNSKGMREIIDKRRRSSYLSPSNSNDEDEYLTAESDTENSEILENTELEASSTKMKLNMSTVASHHQEWLKQYKKMLRHKSATRAEQSGIVERKRKLSTHTNKLETRWVKELKKKRQRCFDIVDEIMKQKPVVEESEVTSPCSCGRCKLTKEFCKILSACQDYVEYAVNTSDIYESKKCMKSHYVSSLRMDLKTDRSVSSRSMGNVKITSKARKLSLAKFASTRAKFSLSTPKSVVTRKNLTPSSSKIVTARTKLTPSPSKQTSSVVSSKKKLSPAVDRSSIAPVSQLRRIYSPKLETAGCSESKISGANQIKLRMNRAAIARDRKPSVRFVASRVPGMSKVVSPVGEYIKGKKKVSAPGPKSQL